MEIIKSDFKKGLVSLRVTAKDDLWYLSHLIEPGDLIKSKTTRKVKIGDADNAAVARKPMTLKIEAETIALDDTGSALRINGKIKEGPHDAPLDSYHSLSLELGSEAAIEKDNWLSFQKQKLKEASEKKYNYLFCLLDREEALLALTEKSGYNILAKLRGDVPKKARKTEVSKNFYQDIIKSLKVYNDRYDPEYIILASPAFYKEDLMKEISSEELRKKIVLATCSDVTEAALPEVTRSQELAKILQNNRAREEELLMEELLKQIKNDGRATYGWKQVKEAIIAGAVERLLLTDEYIHLRKLDGSYQELDGLMQQVDNLNGAIHVLSIEFSGGQKLKGLGGIAAILRYQLKWVKLINDK
ncbi:MAG TPA: mRNA surveillance protein pelota [Candidatus Nanoarchaeia archaeon]|nr:mRNA surveillance protein pelota [Candidatus Nanoarchaeia archaeon]